MRFVNGLLRKIEKECIIYPNKSFNSPLMEKVNLSPSFADPSDEPKVQTPPLRSPEDEEGYRRERLDEVMPTGKKISQVPFEITRDQLDRVLPPIKRREKPVGPN